MTANRMKSFLPVLLVISTFMICFGCRADVVEVCASPTVTTKLTKEAGKYGLMFYVENKANSAISVEEFYFGENMLHLRAIQSLDKTELRQVIPLLSPGVGNATLSPGESFVREVNLNAFFPDLQKTLMNSNVFVSWELTIRGIDSCFQQKIIMSMMIGQQGEKGA